jgi:hypothetical protein
MLAARFDRLDGPAGQLADDADLTQLESFDRAAGQFAAENAGSAVDGIAFRHGVQSFGSLGAFFAASPMISMLRTTARWSVSLDMKSSAAISVLSRIR